MQLRSFLCPKNHRNTKTLYSSVSPIYRAFACLCIGSMILCFASQRVSAANYETWVPLLDNGSSAFYVRGAIAGFGATQFMVDTGSGYTTIDEKTLATLEAKGQAEYVRDLSGTMADGSQRRVPVYRLAKIHIGELCVFRDVEAAVFQGSPRNILGLNILTKAAPFTVSVEPPLLMLSNCSQAIPATTAVSR